LVSLFLTKTQMHVTTLMQKWLAWAPSIWSIWERNLSLVFQSANDNDDDSHFGYYCIWEMCKDPKSYQIPSTEEEYIKQSSKSPTKDNIYINGP
jgi:hypothetical protein